MTTTRTMIFELRSYDLIPGRAPDYLDLFRREGVALVTRHLPLAGFWLTDSGVLNRLYHLWIYRDLAERDTCRAALGADRDWTEGFVPRGFPLILRQENRLMRLVSGSPALDRVTASRRDQKPAQAATDPMFAPGRMALEFGGAGDAGAGDRVGHWRVLTGAGPGRGVALWRFGTADPLAADPPDPGPECDPDRAAVADRQELLRALSLSPLR